MQAMAIGGLIGLIVALVWASLSNFWWGGSFLYLTPEQ